MARDMATEVLCGGRGRVYFFFEKKKYQKETLMARDNGYRDFAMFSPYS